MGNNPSSPRTVKISQSVSGNLPPLVAVLTGLEHLLARPVNWRIPPWSCGSQCATCSRASPRTGRSSRRCAFAETNRAERARKLRGGLGREGGVLEVHKNQEFMWICQSGAILWFSFGFPTSQELTLVSNNAGKPTPFGIKPSPFACGPSCSASLVMWKEI